MIMVGNKVVAVDLGGTNLRAALVRDGNILNYVKRPTPKTKEGLLKVLIEVISEVFGYDVKAIGMGSPGPLKNGVILNPPNIALKNFNLKKFLRNKFKVRVEVENDAKCAALAEMTYGVKKKNFVILTLGTGIGGGIIINGKLYKGRGNAGEIGHTIIDDDKDIETHWQNYRKMSKKYFGKILTINELCKSRDKRARKIIKYVSLYLGQGIANIIDVFDPEVIVLMGGAREAGNKFLNQIKKEAYKFALVKSKTLIVWSRIKYPGLLGASLLVRR